MNAYSSVEDVINQLGSDAASGLSDVEATRRLDADGANELEAEEEEPLWRKFLDQFKDPLIGLLLASALVSVLVKQYDDAVSIALAVAIVSTVAFVQEYRSEQSIAALAELIPPACTCLRDGVVQKIEGEHRRLPKTFFFSHLADTPRPLPPLPFPGAAPRGRTAQPGSWCPATWWWWRWATASRRTADSWRPRT